MVVELSASQISIGDSAYVLQECRVIHTWPAQKLAASQMRTVPLMKNVTTKLEIAIPFASTMIVLEEQGVKRKIIGRSAPVTIPYKAMVTLCVLNVRQRKTFFIFLLVNISTLLTTSFDILNSIPTNTSRMSS